MERIAVTETPEGEGKHITATFAEGVAVGETEKAAWENVGEKARRSKRQPEPPITAPDGYMLAASNRLGNRIMKYRKASAAEIDEGDEIFPRDPKAEQGGMTISARTDGNTQSEKEIQEIREAVKDILLRGWKPLDRKFLQRVQDIARESESREITMNFNAEAELFGLKPGRDFNTRAEESIKRLSVPFFSFKDESKDLSAGFHIIGDYSRKGSKIKITIGNPLFEYIKRNNFYVLMPKSAYRLDDKKFPYAFSLFKYLCDEWKMSYGQENHGIISVKKAMNCFTGLPSYGAVKVGNRDFTGRIISPFIETVEYLERRLSLQLEFCGPRKAPLTEEQCDNYSIDYETLMSLYLRYELLNYPEEGILQLTQKLEKRNARIEKRIADKIADATAKKQMREHSKN